jgi:hypothetical protein
MTDLERVLVDGFLVHYAYPIELINECMFDDLPFDLATLRAIVMVWTGDHPAQCKVGAVKSGGILGVNVTMIYQDGVLNPAIRVWWNTMTIENIGGIHPPYDV